MPETGSASLIFATNETKTPGKRETVRRADSLGRQTKGPRSSPDRVTHISTALAKCLAKRHEQLPRNVARLVEENR